MGRNHEFTLPSGVLCEVTEMLGKHQRFLTEQSSGNMGESLNKVLLDVIVRIGDITDITPKLIDDLLACDRQKILIELRQFTLDFDEEFSFHIEYKDNSGNKKQHLITHNFRTQGDFPVENVKKLPEGIKTDLGDYSVLEDAKFESYDEVLANKEVYLTLPRSGKKVRWTMLDGHGERIGIQTKKSARSSHTPLRMRKVIRFNASANRIPAANRINVTY